PRSGARVSTRFNVRIERELWQSPTPKVRNEGSESVRKKSLKRRQVLREPCGCALHRFSLDGERGMRSAVKLPFQLALRVRHVTRFILQASDPSRFGDVCIN